MIDLIGHVYTSLLAFLPVMSHNNFLLVEPARVAQAPLILPRKLYQCFVGT